jgi:hypothetical protein
MMRAAPRGREAFAVRCVLRIQQPRMLLNVELGNPVPAGHSSLSLGLPSIVCTWILSIDGLPGLLSQFGPDRQTGLL